MLTNVVVTPDVMSACWAHALITEKEEIMGLLVGKMVEDTLVISAMKVIRRLTKQKDRVEIDNRDLIAGAEFAESLPGSLSVSGWYHSHPHITVHPSHVDLATQASYQIMDKDFVGLIFSVFNYDPNTGIDTREVAAFQSVKGEGGNNVCRNIPLTVEASGDDLGKTVLDAMASIPAILMEEEMDEYNKAMKNSSGVMDRVHNQACLVTHLAKQSSLVTGPMLDSIRLREKSLEEDIKRLEEMKGRLLEKLNSMK